MRIRWRGFELPTHVTMEPETATERYGKFTAEPFERGYGVTIGNSLRRVLLSSLEGAAASSIRLAVTHKGEDGKQKTTHVSHEFTAIPGVYEDVTDIVLNMKNLLKGGLVRTWFRDSIERVNAMAAGFAPALAQDGGLPVHGLLSRVDEKLQRQMINEFFLS
mgnify:CR=1 FL=1